MADAPGIRVHAWERFQHYKHRSPPWIKLHKSLLDNPDWYALAGDAAKALVGLWLIASEEDGELPTIGVLAFRLRTSSAELAKHVKSLADKGFLDCASNVLAECLQDAGMVLPQSRVEESRVETEEKTPPDGGEPELGTALVECDPPPTGADSWTGANVVGAYVEYCRAKGWPDPPASMRAKQGAAGKRLADRNPPATIIQAMVGMGTLFPHCPPSNEPWDLFDLERKFTKAHAAVMNDPKLQEAAFDEAFLRRAS